MPRDAAILQFVQGSGVTAESEQLRTQLTCYESRRCFILVRQYFLASHFFPSCLLVFIPTTGSPGTLIFPLVAGLFFPTMTTRTPKQPLPKILAPHQIMPTMEKIVTELRRVRDEVAQDIQPSEACFGNAIKPLIDVENRTQGEVGVIAMLRYAAPEEEARAASEEACKLWSEGESAFKAREDIYLILKAVKDRFEPLSAEATKYLHTLFLDFRRAGHGLLNAEQIQEYAQRMLRIEDLKRQYNQNLRDEDEAVLFRREELQGVPQHAIDRFPVSSDLLRVSFRQDDRQAVMKYAENAATRKTLWVASEKKVPQNCDIFKEAMILRDVNARLLGYESHAAFRVEKKVTKTPGRVINLMDSLEDALMPRGKMEMHELLTLRRKHLGGSGETFNSMPPWDYTYYTRIAEENLGLDQTEISEYFPLEYTVGAMLGIFASFLQLRFDRLASLSEEHRWHEDVMAWSVWDERESADGAFVGYLYADLLSQPNKYQGNQNVNLQCVSAMIHRDLHSGNAMITIDYPIRDIQRTTGAECIRPRSSCVASHHQRRSAVLCSSTTRSSRYFMVSSAALNAASDDATPWILEH